jgi:hypothetical protein
MQESPRRSRRSPPKGRGSLPLIPVFIGVIFLGFVVGAGLSVVGKHGSSPDAVALATSTPEAEPTLVRLTPVPVVRTSRSQTFASPSPEPSPSARPSPNSTLPAAPSSSQATVTRAPTAAPAQASPVPGRSPTGAPAEPVSVTNPPTQPPTQPPAQAPTAEATATPVPVPPVVPVQADSAFARLAGSVVREYLLSISRGDSESAFAALGEPPGSSHQGTLPEVGAVDASMRIQRIEAHGGDSAATVNVDVMTASGPFSGQYTVRRSATGAAIIVAHTFGKP